MRASILLFAVLCAACAAPVAGIAPAAPAPERTAGAVAAEQGTLTLEISELI